MTTVERPVRLAVHKFSSCDGCQVALLSLGADLFRLAQVLQIAHFAEFGVVDEEAEVDIALIEGSVSTEEEVERIRKVRENSRWVVAVGACATSGGIQALRNHADAQEWAAATYGAPERLRLAAAVSPISSHIRVDVEIWGCPVTSEQILRTVRHLQRDTVPGQDAASVCLECKRNGRVCVVVTKGLPCMGPVTRVGCGAVCPSMGRECYACTGPAENPNPESMARRLVELGMPAKRVSERFLSIHSGSRTYQKGAETAGSVAAPASDREREEANHD